MRLKGEGRKIRTIIVFIGLIFVWPYPCPAASKRNVVAARGLMLEAIPSLQIPFITNTGQVSDEVKYYARTFGGTLYVTKKGDMVYVLSKTVKEIKPKTEKYPHQKNRKTERIVLKERLLNAKKTEPQGMEKEDTRINCFIGSRSQWRVDIPAFKRVSLGRVYQGIDLSLTAHGKRLEKVFTVHPDGRVRDIRLGIDVATSLRVNAGGELEVDLEDGTDTVKFSRPIAFQEIWGRRRHVHVSYDVAGTAYGFRVGEYDRSRPLVIDPVLSYSTYLGGGGKDRGYEIAVDEFENVYITGNTESADFPAMNAYQGTHASGAKHDAFVTKLDTSGQVTSSTYSTYLGGTEDDRGYGIAVDHSGNAYITGYTKSPDFPMVNAMQPIHAGNNDVFLTKLDESGQLGGVSTFSTYVGGNNDDRGNGIAVSPSGNTVYITGQTNSNNFPLKNEQQTNQGDWDAFVTLLDISGQSIYSTYLGGGNKDYGYGIAVEGSGNTVYVTGATESWDFPTMNPDPELFRGDGYDAFVTKLDDSGQITTSTFSTYLGGWRFFGSCDDVGRHIAVDDLKNVYIAGDTECWSFPTMNAYQQSLDGDYDAFVTKLDPSGQLTASTFSTFLGGTDDDVGYGIAVCCSGEVYITGYTQSANFPVLNAYQESHGGGTYDAFVTKFSDSGDVIYSTYFGGDQDDYGRGIAVHTGNAYFTGETESADLPIENAYQGSNAGQIDAFVGKFFMETTGKHFYFGKAHNLED